MNRIKHHYIETVKKDLLVQYQYTNINKIPSIEKITLNFGLKDAALDAKLLIPSLLALELIGNQKSYITRSKKSLITLKIRKGMPIGCKITLRKEAMYNFLDLLITQILPKVQNFKGISAEKYINQNTLSTQLQDHFTFPLLESNFERFQNLPPLNISIQTTAKYKNETQSLLTGLQFPLI